MTTYPFPAWEPDKSRLNPAASATIKNVVPVQDGYGPMNGLEPFSDALPAACKGAKLCLASDATAHVFAGTTTGLFKLSTMAWTDVSGPSAPYSLADGDYWQFAQHEDNVVATQLNDPVQKFELQVDTDFEDLAGSPPQAKYVCTESGYLTLGHIVSQERTVRRSGYKNIEFWTIGHRGADQEELSDGGLVAGFAPFSQGALIFQERKIRRMDNIPGQEVSFSLVDVDPTRGAVAPLSIVQFGQTVEYYAEDGFHRVTLGGSSEPIGAEVVDRTFQADIDLARLFEMQGVADPVRRMSWWRYSSLANASTTATDKLIGRHWELGKWVQAEIATEWLLAAALPAYTLEEMETVLGYATLEAVPYSLDSRVWKGSRPAFAAVDADHKLAFFEGDYLEALMDSADIPIGGEGLRGYVSGFRIVGDVSGAYGSIATKETLHGSATLGAEASQNATGLIPIRVSGRTTRFRIRIPSDGWGAHPVISGIEIPAHNMRAAGRR